MDFQATENEPGGNGDAKVCKPGGVPVYGRVSTLVAEYLDSGREVEGLRVWYRCASCQRTVRIEEEASHNETYHFKVQCTQCHGLIDKHQLVHHQRVTCPKLKTFCKYCSVDMTLDEIRDHQEMCIGAKMAKSKLASHDVPSLENIQLPPDSVAGDLINLASKMSNMAIIEQFPMERLRKYKSDYGYRLFPIKERDGESQVGIVNECLERRHHQQLKQQENALCKYFSKKSVAPEDKIKRFLQSYALNRETELKMNLIPRPASRHSGTASQKTKPGVLANGIQPQQYTRIIHDVTGGLCRQDARRFDDRRRQKLMVKNVTKFNRRLTRNSLQEDQKFVIKQAMSLEKNKAQVDNISDTDWPEFIQGVQKTRPIWADLGISAADKNRGKNVKVPSESRLDRIKSILGTAMGSRAQRSVEQ